MVLWPLWSEFLLSWARTRRYWFNTLANLGGSLLYFYAILLGFSRLTPEEGRFLDPGPLLLVFTAFNLTLFTFQSIAYTVQGEAQLGTLEHMALARGGLLRQLLLRALVQSLFGVLWSLLVLLPLALAFGVALGPLARWPLAPSRSPGGRRAWRPSSSTSSGRPTLPPAHNLALPYPHAPPPPHRGGQGEHLPQDERARPAPGRGEPGPGVSL